MTINKYSLEFRNGSAVSAARYDTHAEALKEAEDAQAREDLDIIIIEIAYEYADSYMVGEVLA